MIHHGDCLDVMATLDAESIDAIVTDPPYGIGFMGKAWDSQYRAVNDMAASLSPGHRSQAWHTRWAESALRVAKPGAYLLSFGGTRTVHRLACAIEDAGWIIRDMLVWGYASGFPKGRANLKPAWEPIVMARKPGPLRPLAIDECRIPFVGDETPDDREGEPTEHTRYTLDGGTNLAAKPGRRIKSDRAESTEKNQHTRYANPGSNRDSYSGSMPERTDYDAPGRWPANVLLTSPILDGGWDGVVGGGETGRSAGGNSSYIDGTEIYGQFGGGLDGIDPGYGDSGTYSRFFILPKAARSDREPVLDEYAYRLHRERGECDKLRSWASADLSLSGPTASTSPARATSGARRPATPTDSNSGTSSPGSPSTVLSPTATRSTTGTATSRTTPSPTSPSLTLSPISASTPGASSETANGGSPAESAASSSLWAPPTGISVPRAGRSTDDADRATFGSSSRASVCGRCGKPLPRVGSHPTVKPTDLMRHLVRLVTPPGGTVLDPFLGSGTTALAAEMEGFGWVGIEKEAEYVAIAEARLNGTQRGLAL